MAENKRTENLRKHEKAIWKLIDGYLSTVHMADIPHDFSSPVDSAMAELALEKVTQFVRTFGTAFGDVREP